MEENKVATREKLAKLIMEYRGGTYGKEYYLGVADSILQSPDLRVTLVVHPTPIAEMIEGLRRNALLSPPESVILDILERMNKEPK